MRHQSKQALLLQASLKRARLEAPPAPAKAATSAVIPSHASQVVMQLEGYCPESFPLDVQHQVCRQQQRWLTKLTPVMLNKINCAIQHH